MHAYVSKMHFSDDSFQNESLFSINAGAILKEMK